MTENRHFTLLVIGNVNNGTIKKYDNNTKSEPYLAYYFKDAHKLRMQQIEMEKKLLNTLLKRDSDIIQTNIQYLENLSDTDFYLELTEDCDLDKQTGDAFSCKNKQGKYDECSKPIKFSLPFITKDGKETFSDLKGNIDWDKIHLTNSSAYEFVWDSVMEGKEPKNEEEKNLYENMKNRTAYLEFFKNRENYVLSNVSFWTYAVITEDGEWHELEGNQVDWIKNFYNTFISNINNNTTLTLYECRRD